MFQVYYIIVFYFYFFAINYKNIFKFSNKKILIFYEPRFEFLVNNLKNNNILVYYIPRPPLYNVWLSYLKDYENIKERENNELYFQFYLGFEKERILFYKFSLKVFKLFFLLFDVKKVILPKVNDDWTIDLINSIYDAGFETYIIDRETVVTSHRLKVIPKCLSGFSIRATKIIVANDNHFEFFRLVSKYADLKAQIVMSGHMASDFWFLNSIKRNFKTDKNFKILYFSFGPHTYLNQLENRNINFSWEDLLNDIHLQFFDLLINNSNFKLTYKISKKGHRDFYQPREKVIHLANCELVGGYVNSVSLIINADLIIGFQSTATLDSFNSDCPIIYPGWGNLFNSIENEILPISSYTNNTGIYHAKSPNEFLYLIKIHIGKKITIEQKIERMKILYKYTNNLYGDVSTRTIKLLDL
jgi:hypothetical protein